MMLLSFLLSKLTNNTLLTINGYDKDCNKYFRVWTGYAWQLIIGGQVADCEVISICHHVADGDIQILCDLTYDERMKKYGFKL